MWSRVWESILVLARQGWKIIHHQRAQRQVKNLASKCQPSQKIDQFQQEVCFIFLRESQFEEESIRGKASL